MNIFGFRPFKGRFNLGNSDDIPTNTDGTLIGAVKKINSNLTASNSQKFRFGYQGGEYGYITESGGADTFHPFKSSSGPTQIKTATAVTWTYQTGSVPSSETIDIKQYVSNWNKLTDDNFIVKVASSGYSTSAYTAKSGNIGSLCAYHPESISYNSSTGVLTFRRPYVEASAYVYSGSWFSSSYTHPAYTLYVI